MENKSMIILVGVIILVLLLIYFFLNQNKSQTRQKETYISSDTGTSTDVSDSSTSVNTSTPTTSTTNTSNPNQVTLSKTIPVYYLQLPTQSGYPHTVSSNAVMNVTLPQGKKITVTKVWNFGSSANPNIYYETSEKVLYITNPSSKGIGDYYLIKKSDV